MESTITAKGQTTIPSKLREQLGLKAGSKIRYFERQDGGLVILPVIPVSNLRGLLKNKLRRPVAIEEMDDAIGAAVTARYLGAR